MSRYKILFNCTNVELNEFYDLAAECFFLSVDAGRVIQLKKPW